MSYIQESLSSGEKIVATFKLHWFAWVPMSIWLLLGLFTTGLTWILAAYEFLRLKFIEQGVTNKRVILKVGIIGRRTQEMKLTSIETVEMDQGVLGRLFGFGTIKVSGRGISNVVLSKINDPASVKRRIESISTPIA